MALRSTIEKSARKMKNGMREMFVSKSDDGKGYIVEHHMHDYGHPKNGMKYICASGSQLKKHIDEHMPLEKKDEDEEE